MNHFKKELEHISKLPLTSQQIALAALLTTCFKEENVELVVVGGAAVQYYSEAEYVTKDLDAILFGDTKDIIDHVMHKLGFKRTSTYRHFEHPFFPFVVEFPPCPVEVGNRHLGKFNLLTMNQYRVQIIRIEDIIMDRIIGGVEWKQEHLLNQAKLLWIKNKTIIDKKYLTQFAKEEGYLKNLNKIIKL
ncbi:MAG: hypothetical protein A3G32_06825 [Deltaproteobacteria bacterium RIFCSPLOWO2_12_FULL_40_28]|nr:MAG: hypothetical protein A3C45_06870 [Deltaproteobacteria bacterium RIFCSPHIGHO2_02_FULL_40_28]OGQ19328.1 MAG: hypothetical protein A3E27_04945 [Deltaproteobacteria bacterium RIFCSPHIGHO2_12_FULL_40_32]OGQ40448.1 MAG: hypothetical protein A3I69_00125 [Deltaproteobacteria bacterium RIFCSPLOWO2_02_FULL_40_36]OGQ53684.1 MAG: hypothetical protein A3G32_06825 [Deltaproteobacteria bacterium RIFCSPLOWO2_12_FULL_40_28]